MRGNDEHAGAAAPDVAVLDLNLPKHGGLEILKPIRKNSTFERMPVVILSSSSSPRERASTKELGVTRFIAKPYTLAIGPILKSLLVENGKLGQSAGG